MRSTDEARAAQRPSAPLGQNSQPPIPRAQRGVPPPATSEGRADVFDTGLASAPGDARYIEADVIELGPESILAAP